MEAKGKALQPEGRTPFDGLAPRDFFEPGEWPHGDLIEPAAFREYPFTDGQKGMWLEAIGLLRDLVLDYRHQVAETKRQAVSNDTGLSANTLSSFNRGARFPKLGTYLTLRAALPDRTRLLREAAALEAKLAEKQTEEYIEAEVRRRMRSQAALEAEVQRRVAARLQAAAQGQKGLPGS